MTTREWLLEFLRLNKEQVRVIWSRDDATGKALVERYADAIRLVEGIEDGEKAKEQGR